MNWRIPNKMQTDGAEPALLAQRLENPRQQKQQFPSRIEDHLAHHFENPRQQFDAAKFGMWLFLATEVLLFGGLFCLYAIFRSNHPEIFNYGSQFLDTTWGAINTAVLIVSSFMMAMAVSCAQRNRQRELIIFLALTLMCAVDFLGIKYIEYSHKFDENLVWGMKFYENPHPLIHQPEDTSVQAPIALQPGNVEQGRMLYRNTCAACHGLTGEGMPGSGKPLGTSTFVGGFNDDEFLGFLKIGRPVNDPLNTTGIPMLPRGGNPSLTDQNLVDIIAVVRELQDEADVDVDGASNQEEEFFIPKTIVQAPAEAPPGLNLAVLNATGTFLDRVDSHQSVDVHHSLDPDRPANAHIFFGIYFLMTGLHGFHVFAGIVVITWLLVRAIRGHFNHEYFTPVDLGGLYWHIVDVIWIFLFPLLYLIR